MTSCPVMLWFFSLVSEWWCWRSITNWPWLRRYLALDVWLSIAVWVLVELVARFGWPFPLPWRTAYLWGYCGIQAVLTPVEVMAGMEVLPERRWYGVGVVLLSAMVGAAVLRPECPAPQLYVRTAMIGRGFAEGCALAAILLQGNQSAHAGWLVLLLGCRLATELLAAAHPPSRIANDFLMASTALLYGGRAAVEWISSQNRREGRLRRP